jgi:tripeptide aminopeptidase
MAPETTSGRDGFLHPYHVEGGVALVQIKILLRSFETAELDQQAELLRSLAAQVTGRHPAVRIELDVRCQYRNMREGLKREPRAVRFAELALKRLGRTPELAIIRGGTDGSRLSEMGLPTPNLSSGQHNPHSPLEWVCLDEMVQAGDMLIELLRIWAENPTRDV